MRDRNWDEFGKFEWHKETGVRLVNWDERKKSG